MNGGPQTLLQPARALSLSLSHSRTPAQSRTQAQTLGYKPEQCICAQKKERYKDTKQTQNRRKEYKKDAQSMRISLLSLCDTYTYMHTNTRACALSLNTP